MVRRVNFRIKLTDGICTIVIQMKVYPFLHVRQDQMSMKFV